VVTQDIVEDGLVAQYIRPEGETGRLPAMIVLGGSEGGTRWVRRAGAQFAAQGYAVLALSYFRADGLPAGLDLIPLEYFGRGLTWLMAQPGVDRNRIGIYGLSKGSEAALLTATRHPEIRAVIAASPSHVAWPGLSNPFILQSSWSEGGAPVPFVPYDTSQGFTSIFSIFQNSLPGVARHPDAVIPVERINGPVLLVSGEADGLWPSKTMADAIVARLRANNFRHRVENLSYPDAGHMTPTPPALGPTTPASLAQMGGTVEGTDRARVAAWSAMLCFLRDALAPAPARRPRR
jgi:dienelactone hydrolase